MNGNDLVSILNTPLTRGLLRAIIFTRYKQRGHKIEKVKYHSDLKIWEFRIDGVSYLSSGPGWVYCYEYLFQQLKSLSGYHYFPHENDVVFDIGAGVGEETIILSRIVGNKGRVYSFEAHPKTFLALEYLANSNQFKNVTLSNVALSDERGLVEIEDSENSLANSILPTENRKKTFKVEAMTFDDYVTKQGLKRIDLVKMNVEGAEQLIIKGMTKSLPFIRHVAISCHDFRFRNGESEFFKTKEIVVRFLEENGFKVITQQTNVNMVDDYVYASNPKFEAS